MPVVFTPLEQFENHLVADLLRWVGGPACGVGGYITVVAVTGVVNTAILLGVAAAGVARPTLVVAPGVQAVVEGWWSALAGVVRQQLGGDQRFTPLFVWTFGWIALNNVVGLFPGAPTTTAQLSTTLALSLGFNLGFLVWGVYHHGDAFFGLFVPSGAPAVLLPLIVVIEIVSYCIRPVSLALRLFANMMAGHTLVHILLQFNAGLTLVGVYPLVAAGVWAVTALEFGIALLQAYVFVVLCCIYFKDALSPAH